MPDCNGILRRWLSARPYEGLQSEIHGGTPFGFPTVGISDLFSFQDQIAATMAYVLRGLVFLHSQKIIHRDLKVRLLNGSLSAERLISRQAGNILLDEQGHAKLADFGVAIQMQSTFQKRATVTGSPYLMAPEYVPVPSPHISNPCYRFGCFALFLCFYQTRLLAVSSPRSFVSSLLLADPSLSRLVTSSVF